MGLLGPELIILIILLIFLLRPKLITDFARGFGKVVKEFKTGEAGERRRKLIDIAKTLGIDPEGKTEEQLLEEIKRKLAS